VSPSVPREGARQHAPPKDEISIVIHGVTKIKGFGAGCRSFEGYGEGVDVMRDEHFSSASVGHRVRVRVVKNPFSLTMAISCRERKPRFNNIVLWGRGDSVRETWGFLSVETRYRKRYRTDAMSKGIDDSEIVSQKAENMVEE
jgi:hypothetical protein